MSKEGEMSKLFKKIENFTSLKFYIHNQKSPEKHKNPHLNHLKYLSKENFNELKSV